VRRALAAAALVLGAAAAPSVARAQSCGRPDLVDMVPPDMATGVPLNARLGAHYATSAEYLGEDVVLVHPPDGRQEVLRECAPNMTKPCATWSRAEQFLQVTPTEPLQPNSSYEIRWPALRGINAAAPGVGGRAMFETGGTDDVAAPVFDGVTGLTWDLEHTNDECTDDQVERYVFDVQLGAANDDGGTSGLTLLLFQTKGPLVMEQPTPFPGRAWPQDQDSVVKHVQVRLSTDLGVGEVCFAGFVRDTTGMLSDSGHVESCVHTTAPPFFRGCSVGGARASTETLAAALALAVLLVRRRSRRST